MKTRWYGALAGIAAAAAALGTAELLAILIGPQSSPLVAVGGVVVDSVPGPVKQFAVSVFYTYDKLALMIGTLVLITVFAAVLGAVAARRGVAWGLAGLGVFGLVGVIAAVTRHNAGPLAILPTVVGVGVAAVLLQVMLSRVPQESSVDRRQFLRLAGGTLAGALAVAFGARWLASRRNVAAERAAIDLPPPAEAASPLPSEVDENLPNLTPFVTPNKAFYLIDTALVVPQVSPETWTLKIHGKVRKPITLTYKQLSARPMIERYVTLACVSNEVGGELIGNALWQGVPLKPLLEEAGPLDGADQVVSRSVDGFTAGTPTAALLDGRDAMLAVAMNGEPLPVQHGFPVRMVVPGLYGYVSATKWLAELELSTFKDFDAYWVPRGWAQQAPIKTESRIDTPSAGSSPARGRVMVAGVAWAQHRGVSKVEVRVDDGPWQEAKLAAVPSIDTWRQWVYAWDATPGSHRLSVRATDNGGATQTQEEAPPDPDGATGWHTIQVTVK